MRRRGGISATTAKRSRVPHPGHVTLNDEGEARDCWLILNRPERVSHSGYPDIFPRLYPLLPTLGTFSEDGATLEEPDMRTRPFVLGIALLLALTVVGGAAEKKTEKDKKKEDESILKA